jgi:ribonuclease HI
MEEIIVYTDGASRGNPGPAGIGVMLCTRSGEIVGEIAEYIGETTNNVAEYRAVIRGLEEAKALRAERVVVATDSQLLVRQILGQYKVKNEGLKPLFDQVNRLRKQFIRSDFIHIPRERNARADALSKKGSNPLEQGKE